MHSDVCREAFEAGSPCQHQWESHTAPLEQIIDTLTFHEEQASNDA